MKILKSKDAEFTLTDRQEEDMKVSSKRTCLKGREESFSQVEAFIAEE